MTINYEHEAAALLKHGRIDLVEVLGAQQAEALKRRIAIALKDAYLQGQSDYARSMITS